MLKQYIRSSVCYLTYLSRRKHTRYRQIHRAKVQPFTVRKIRVWREPGQVFPDQKETKKILNESKVGVNSNVAVVRLLGSRHVDFDQRVHAVDGATFQNLLRRQAGELNLHIA